ncbi:MAG: hypothetical protein HeimC3_01030 [Candidatus Heimdallarchaeota archaeon LC_3]|nr:MAG: hypothetical protein HeimC3_01030 [Candidatus Heimdallarchaeota archaeon LC_3]
MKKTYFLGFSVFLLIGIFSFTPISHVISTSSDNIKFQSFDEDKYWYTLDQYQNPAGNSEWVPFFSLTDVPYSLPLRGFLSDSRSAFFDLGAFEWFSDWVQNVWGNALASNCENNFHKLTSIQDQSNCIQYFFETLTERLTTGDLSLDYAKNLKSFNIWAPLIVYDNMTSKGYENSSLSEWIVNPHLVQNTLNTQFPLLNFTTDLLWFDPVNLSSFNDLIYNNSVWSEPEDVFLLQTTTQFLSETDTIIHNILTTFNSSEYDLIFPSMLLLQSGVTLYYPGFGKIGGLGQINSAYSDIGSWTIQGRNELSYFYGGDPEKPRDNLDSTVLHELGHSIGIPHPHDIGAWYLDSITESTMTYYSRSAKFDSLNTDLVLNGLSLQLIGKYEDEIEYYKSLTLNSTQNNTMFYLENQLFEINNLLYQGNYTGIQLLFKSLEGELIDLENELGQLRKQSGFGEKSPPLNMHIDFIVGEGFLDREIIVNMLNQTFTQSSEVLIASNTFLPKPNYQLTTQIHSTNNSYQSSMKSYWQSLLTSDVTSLYDPDLVPSDAWDKYPRNRIFTTQSGYSINAYQAEDWLVDHPATPNKSNSIHYRFYLFDFTGLVPTDISQVPSSTTSSETITTEIKSSITTTTTNGFTGSFALLTVGTLTTIILINKRKKK